MNSENHTSYGHILKTTFMFGFVQVFKAVFSIIRNKLVAILIGTEGMGLMGIYTSTISLIKTGAGLGLDQSAVRDVSEAFATNNREKYSRIINITTRVVLFTGLLGMIITLVMSHWLSVWTLGGTEYTIAYCFLGFAVFLDIMNDGRQALLKGTRQLKSLAYASMIGSVVGFVSVVPLLYFLGKDGIVPSLLIASACALLVSNYFVNRIDAEKIKVSLKETFHEAQPMLKMGSAMMLMTFLQTIVSLIVQSYIRSKGGLEDVGLFSAGNMILQSYFGVVITAFMTDYYPRIAAVNNDNVQLQDELNKQSKVSLLLCGPLFVIFVSFAPVIIKLLYTDSFLPAVDYLYFAIYYTLITACSNQVDLILVAKYRIKTFTIISVFIRVLQLVLYISLYSLMGLKGLGIGVLILGVFHYLIMTTVVNKLYGIHFDNSFYRLFLIILVLALLSSSITSINTSTIRYLLGALLSGLVVFYSLYFANKIMNINVIQIIRNRIKK